MGERYHGERDDVLYIPLIENSKTYLPVFLHHRYRSYFSRNLDNIPNTSEPDDAGKWFMPWSYAFPEMTIHNHEVQVTNWSRLAALEEQL